MSKIMASKLELLFLSILFFSFIIPVRLMFTTDDTNFWCNQTPNPDTCKYYMRQRPKRTSSMARGDFRTVAVQLAIDQAFVALNNSMQLGHKCKNKLEKAAWTDCVKLYNLTLLQLNQIVDVDRKPTDLDIQTWVSAALTNLHTCNTGFFELNVTNNIFPHMSDNNVTELIANILAINSVSADVENDRKGFASWLTENDKWLLQSQMLLSPLKLGGVVVAQDGSGDYQTIGDAVKASLKRKSDQRFVIYVKKGVYKEYVEITYYMKNIMLVGDGLTETIITGDRSNADKFSTYDSGTVKVKGDGFIARDITFENTAGPQKGQAVALASMADQSVFFRCGIYGYQDTLLVHSQRQFFQKCQISGTVDFIFGNAAVIFQNCLIYARRPLPGGGIVITAQARTTPNDPSGISIQNSMVLAAPELLPVLNQFKVYLGRPWQAYARTVYLQTFLDRIVDPAGWLPWGPNEETLKTLYYAEYKNYGPGSSTQNRVKWPGYHVIQDIKEAETFCVQNFIGGQYWLPVTGVPFILGLNP